MKRTIAIILAMIMLLSVSVFALEVRLVPVDVNLSFNGTTANCEMSATASNMNQQISATIKLYRGTTCLHTWNVSDYGTLDFAETWTVSKGYTYKLTADVTINGTTYPTVSTSQTCS